MGGGGVVVRGVFDGAAWHGCATTVEAVRSQVAPVVLVQHNPLAVFFRRAGAGDPISGIAVLHGGLPNKGVVLRGGRHSCHIPSRSWVAVPIAHGVNLNKRRLVPLHQHEPVVSIREERERLVGLRQNQRVGRRVRNDVHIAGEDDRSRIEGIPVLEFSHHAWCVAYVGVSVADKSMVQRSGCKSLLVVGAAFSSLGEERLSHCAQAEEAIRVKQANTRE